MVTLILEGPLLIIIIIMPLWSLLCHSQKQILLYSTFCLGLLFGWGQALKSPLHSKMCFSYCSFTCMFELHCAEWCTVCAQFDTGKAVFTITSWRRKVCLSCPVEFSFKQTNVMFTCTLCVTHQKHYVCPCGLTNASSAFHSSWNMLQLIFKKMF